MGSGEPALDPPGKGAASAATHPDFAVPARDLKAPALWERRLHVRLPPPRPWWVGSHPGEGERTGAKQTLVWRADFQ